MAQKQQRSYHVNLKANATSIRTESLRGQDYVVVPVVMLVECVLQGATAAGPELALASEFGQNPTAWNGCPVPVAHPKRDGQFVSAGSPGVWEAEVIGFLFNTTLVDDALCSELWLNTTWANDSGYESVLQTLQAGGVMEVSTGLFTELVNVHGVYKGKTYASVWTNVVPDHLALPPDDTGACSVAMGAGTNREPGTVTINAAQLKQMGQNNQRLMVVNAALKEIAMPSKEAVKAQKPSIFQRMLSAVALSAQEISGEVKISPMEQAFRDNLQGISDGDLRTAISAALAVLSPQTSCYIVAVFDDRVVYEVYDYDRGSWCMMSISYSAVAGGAVSFANDAMEVRPLTTFVPVVAEVMATPAATTMEIATMSSDTQTPVAAPATQPAVTDETATTAPATPEPAVANTTVDSTAPAGVASDAVATGDVPTMESLAASLGANVDTIKDALAVHASTKAALVTEITACAENSFSAEELNSFTVQQLSKMASLGRRAAAATGAVGTVNYGAAGGAVVPQPEPTTNAVVKAFPLLKAS